MADILKQYARQTLTAPLEAQALELIGLAEKATEGPWAITPRRADESLYITFGSIGLQIARMHQGAIADAVHNGSFVAYARNHAPAIARAYLEARAEIERLRTAHEKIVGIYSTTFRAEHAMHHIAHAALHPQPDTSDKGETP